MTESETSRYVVTFKVGGEKDFFLRGQRRFSRIAIIIIIKRKDLDGVMSKDCKDTVDGWQKW